MVAYFWQVENGYAVLGGILLDGRGGEYFLSADGNDTLRVRDLVVDFDTLKRSYNWSQYAD